MEVSPSPAQLQLPPISSAVHYFHHLLPLSFAEVSHLSLSAKHQPVTTGTLKQQMQHFQLQNATSHWINRI